MTGTRSHHDGIARSLSPTTNPRRHPTSTSLLALARPISRAGVRPRPKGGRLERPGPGTPTCLLLSGAGEREKRREKEEERQGKKVASKEARSQEKATGGRTSGKRVMIIDCGQFPSIEPPISHAAFQFQTLSSRAAAHITSRHLLVYLSLASRSPGLCFPRESCFLPRRLKCRPSTS